MAQTDILREFLVRVGYESDRASEARFVRGVEDVTRTIQRMGLALAAVTGTVGALAVRMSSSLEGLYYSSQRVGSSVQNIRAFGFAVSQMGGSNEEARASLENLSRAMRDNPGVRGLVQQLTGGQADTADGVATMQALGRAFRAMPYHIARQYAGMLGIDENTMRALMEGTDRFSARYHEMARRLGMDSRQSAQSAVEFQRALRELELIGQFALERLVIALARIAPAMLQGAEQFTLWLEETIPKIDEFVRSTIGWNNALILLGVALTAHLLTPLLRIASTLGLLSVFRIPAWLLALLGVSGAAALGAGAGALLLNPGSANAGEREALERLRRGEDPFPNAPPNSPEGVPAPPPPSMWDRLRSQWRSNGQLPAAPEEQQRRGQEALEFFQRMGWGAAQAAGIVAQMEGESRFQPTAFNSVGGGNGAFGINQWRGPRQVALGQFVSQQRGTPTDFRQATFQEQLAFTQHELTQGAERRAGEALRRATSAGQAAEIMLRQYGRGETHLTEQLLRQRGPSAERWFQRSPSSIAPAGTARETGEQPGRNPTGAPSVAQTTTITVNGAGEPTAVAARVAEAQRGVNTSLVRNLQNVLR